MGKGSTSGKNTAVKQQRASVTGAEGGGQDQQAANSCLFQFSVKVLLPATHAIKVGQPVALVQNSANISQLDIFIGSDKLGQYTGPHLQRLLECMSAKYSYTGKVDSVAPVGTGQEVVYTVRGHSYVQSAAAV